MATNGYTAEIWLGTIAKFTYVPSSMLLPQNERFTQFWSLKGMLHWRKYTTFTMLCINSIIYLEAICP